MQGRRTTTNRTGSKEFVAHKPRNEQLNGRDTKREARRKRYYGVKDTLGWTKPDQKAEVTVSTEETRMFGPVLGALLYNNKEPCLFEMSGKVVTIIIDKNGEPTIAPVTKVMLKYRVDQCCKFSGWDAREKKVVGKNVPTRLVDSLHELTIGKFPYLQGITRIPIVRPDGSILGEPGYDEVTRLLYLPSNDIEELDIPETASQGDAKNAASALLDLFGDFPFSGEADRANIIAALLTPLVFTMTGGQIPIRIVDAPKMGTGKTLLEKLFALIITGRTVATNGKPENDEEMRKVITTAHIYGKQFLCFDNWTGKVESSPLCEMITTDMWSDRILGSNTSFSSSASIIVSINGNNILMNDEIADRSYRIRLVSNEATPSLRTDIRIKDIESYVLEHRIELLQYLYTMIVAWKTAGMPLEQENVLNRFRRWSGVIGGIARYTGIDRLLTNRAEVYQQVEADSDGYMGFLIAWHELFGSNYKSAKEVAKEIDDNQGCDLAESMPPRLHETLKKGGVSSLSNHLGNSLRRQVDIRYNVPGTLGESYPDRLYLDKPTTDSHTRKQQWRVVLKRHDISAQDIIDYIDSLGDGYQLGYNTKTGELTLKTPDSPSGPEVMRLKPLIEPHYDDIVNILGGVNRT